MYQRPKPNFYPLASEGVRNVYFPYNDVHKAGQDPVMLSHMENIPDKNVTFNGSSILREDVTKPNIPNEVLQGNIGGAPLSKANSKKANTEISSGTMAGFKLFGFTLTGETPTTNLQSSNKRSCTKVKFSKHCLFGMHFLGYLRLINNKLGEGPQTRQLGWKSY